MAFRTKSVSKYSIESPESLFADIKTKKIPGLLTQQGDLLREYLASFVHNPDVAAQLPTGSGKTLVALLIAEWRRLKFGERVVYLCPTKQLVHQVTHQSNDTYGINVIPFTGSVRDYNAGDKARYNASQAVAITTYSSLFNTNPFFNDPHTVILDDAHSGEQYVADGWTIELRAYKAEDQVIFNAISAVLHRCVDSTSYRRLTTAANSSADASWVEKIPYQEALQFHQELEGVIDANVGDSPAKYAWSALEGRLAACNIFLTSQGITIRPYLAPTFSHSPFAGATQRLYLSATPGEGGELERVFCRKRIARLTPPAGSERHAIGRRFFVFPEHGLDENDQQELLKHLGNSKRLLVLTGDNSTAETYKKFFREQTASTVFGPSDIEISKEVFVNTTPAVAVLANRYDGIDFPGNECRITTLVDIPTAANSQEKFFISRMSGTRIYDARILTRVIQSFGRCTRSSTDFSVVVVFGDRIVSFLTKKDRREFFHPELQGELLFGLNESAGASLSNTLDNIEHFLLQDAEWQGAESEIYRLRDTVMQSSLPGSSDLASAVQHEVEFVEALWNGNISGALDACKAVLGKLTDPTLRGVRALWNYFAGSMAARLALEDSDRWRSVSHEYYREAAKAAPNLSWLHGLSAKQNPEIEDATLTLEEAFQIDGIESLFVTLGTSHNRNFDSREAGIRAALASTEEFEAGHVALGQFLGFDSGKKELQGSPDPWWRAGDALIFVFEDHAGASTASELSITKARQAATHSNWIKENLHPPTTTTIVQVLVTPVSKVGAGGMCHLTDVRIWSLDAFRSWAELAMATIRELRQSFVEPGDLDWRTCALQTLRERGLTAVAIRESLQAAGSVLTESK